MSQEQIPATDDKKLDFQSRFQFRCHPGVGCFTNCCADVTIFLTPYDVLRLKNRLGLNSSEFMEKHTHLLTKPDQIIPLVVLKMSDDEGKKCAFVTDEGCTVYEDRPWACRMFPLDVDNEERFSIIAKAEKCFGLLEDGEMRVIEWLEDQGVMDYQRVNNYFSEIANHPMIKELDVTNDRVRQMIYMATYDLDKFKEFVLGTRFRSMFDFDEDFLERIRVDDTELLKLGLDWIRFGLFGEKTLKIRPEVLEAQKRARQNSGA
jgi:Fe-S-cluster containining protein